jgi:hypothetical protein
MIGGIHMRRQYDILHAIILLLFLVIANLIGNTIVEGIMLLFFSAALFFNIILRFKSKKNDKLKYKILSSVLLLLVVALTVSSVYVIVISIIRA